MWLQEPISYWLAAQIDVSPSMKLELRPRLQYTIRPYHPIFLLDIFKECRSQYSLAFPFFFFFGLLYQADCVSLEVAMCFNELDSQGQWNKFLTLSSDGGWGVFCYCSTVPRQREINGKMVHMWRLFSQTYCWPACKLRFCLCFAVAHICLFKMSQDACETEFIY